MANILAVDDDEKIREWLHVILRRKGHHVITAGAGSDEREKHARELGFSEFLVKGCSLRELGAAVNLVVRPPIKTVVRVLAVHEQ
jgi:DNA-binding response OmpR family regulator